MAHPDVAGVSVTGSVPVGVAIHEAGAHRLLRTQLELGGKNAVIVLADTDLDKATDAIVHEAFGQAGQRCSATSRVVVDRAVEQELLDRLVERVAAMRVGPGAAPDTDICPVVGEGRLAACVAAVEEAQVQGAKVACGVMPCMAGRRASPWSPPCCATSTRTARSRRRRSFGPVLPVIGCDGFDDGMRISNSVRYGMSGTLFTQDPARIFEALDRFETGMLHVNRPGVGAYVHLPHSGSKASQFGPPECSPQVWDFYTEWRSACITYGAERRPAESSRCPADRGRCHGAQAPPFVDLPAGARVRRVLRGGQEAVHEPAVVSGQVRRLEQSLRTTLVDRSGARIRPTAEGQVLAEYTRRIFLLADEAVAAIHQVQGLAAGRIVVAGTSTVGTYLPAPLLARFLRDRPGLEHGLRVGNGEQVQRWPLDREVGLAVLAGRPDSPQLVVRPGFTNRLVLIGPPDHPLAGRTTSPRELAGERFLMRARGSATRLLQEEGAGTVGLGRRHHSGHVGAGDAQAVRRCRPRRVTHLRTRSSTCSRCPPPAPSSSPTAGIACSPGPRRRSWRCCASSPTGPTCPEPQLTRCRRRPWSRPRGRRRPPAVRRRGRRTAGARPRSG